MGVHACSRSFGLLFSSGHADLRSRVPYEILSYGSLRVLRRSANQTVRVYAIHLLLQSVYLTLTSFSDIS